MGCLYPCEQLVCFLCLYIEVNRMQILWRHFTERSPATTERNISPVFMTSEESSIGSSCCVKSTCLYHILGIDDTSSHPSLQPATISSKKHLGRFWGPHSTREYCQEPTGCAILPASIVTCCLILSHPCGPVEWATEGHGSWEGEGATIFSSCSLDFSSGSSDDYSNEGLVAKATRSVWRCLCGETANKLQVAVSEGSSFRPWNKSDGSWIWYYIGGLG